MSMLDQIGKEKRRINDQLTRFDAKRANLSDQLNDLEIAQRAVRRFGDKAVATKKRRRAPAPKTAPMVGAERSAQGGQQAQGISLGDATLRAVRAHPNGASTDALLKHLSRRFAMTVRPNHLGGALHRHQRAGRLENRDQRWYLPR